MSAQGLPHLIRLLWSDARFTAPLLSHHTVTGGLLSMLPMVARARGITLIAQSPRSSPRYKLASVEYSEKDPASREPVAVSMSMSIHPAAHT